MDNATNIWDDEVAKWKTEWRAREAALADRHRQERNDLRDQKRLDWNRMRNEIYKRQQEARQQVLDYRVPAVVHW